MHIMVRHDCARRLLFVSKVDQPRQAIHDTVVLCLSLRCNLCLSTNTRPLCRSRLALTLAFAFLFLSRFVCVVFVAMEESQGLPAVD